MLEPTTPTGHTTGEPQLPADTPPPGVNPSVVVVGSPEWDELTARRCELIYEKNRQGLTADEQTEFDHLQELCRAAIAVAFPRPTIWDEQMDAIKKRLTAADLSWAVLTPSIQADFDCSRG